MPMIGTTVQKVSLRASQLNSSRTPAETCSIVLEGGADTPGAPAESARNRGFIELLVLAKFRVLPKLQEYSIEFIRYRGTYKIHIP